MKKIQSVFIFIVALFILSVYHTSNAWLSITCPEGKSFVQEEMKCMTEQEKTIAKQNREEQARIDEENRIKQEKIYEAQKETQRIEQEKIDAQATAGRIRQWNITQQQEAEKIQKENADQLRIKDLEDRIKKLESQRSSLSSATPAKKITVDTSIPNKKEEIKNFQTKPILGVNNEILIKEPAISSMETSNVPQEKVGWFKRLLNLFNWSKK